MVNKNYDFGFLKVDNSTLGRAKFDSTVSDNYKLNTEKYISFNNGWAFQYYLRIEGSTGLHKFRGESPNWLKSDVKINFRIVPGLVDLNEEFYAIPVPIGLLIMREIECSSESYKMIDKSFNKEVTRCHTILRFKVSVYDTEINEFPIEAKIDSVDRPKIIERILQIINTINLWVCSGRKIDLINRNVLFNHKLRPKVHQDILKSVNQLEVKIFRRQISYPGKDSNVFYTQTELHTLPKDRYLLELLKLSVRADFHYGHKAIYTEKSINFVLDRESEALPATTGIWEIEDIGNTMTLEIKDTLKLGMINRYSETEAILSCVS